jgi:F-type H+-transporting ATPase subunit alpha
VRPAINVGISVSRVGGSAQINPMRKVAGRMKGELSQFRDLEAFASFGSDLDEDTQRTLARGNRLVATLNQGEHQPIPAAEQVVIIYAATNGYIDRVAVERVPDFNQQLVDRLRAEAADTLEKIGGGDWSDETQAKVKEIVSEFADDFGYDLDEEGKPVDEDVDVDDRRKASSDDEEGGEAEASEEQEPGEADGERSETGAGAAA